MAGLDRRTVIRGALAAGAVLSVPSVAGAAVPRPSVFVVDTRFTPSAAFALEWSKLGVAVIEARRDDLGIAWRKRIPDLLARNGGGIAGVTLWSDLLICQMFAREHGFVLASPSRAVTPAAGADLHHWMLSAQD
jgi:hypothetical protein